MTTGPWRVGNNQHGAVVSVRPVVGRNMDARDVEYYGGHLVCESIASKEDAALIAAAPELLAALRLLLADTSDSRVVALALVYRLEASQ